VVVGSTMPTANIVTADIDHKIPEIGGIIETEVFVLSPPGWICLAGCYTRTSRRSIFEVTVTAPNISSSPLSDPSPSDPYTKLRTPDSLHINEEVYYGTDRTLRVLPKVAEEFFRISGRKLSVNDMSLRYGGVFDVNGNWKPSHATHRGGKDVDINQRGTPCLPDHELRRITNMMLPKVLLSNGTLRQPLLCESGGRKHIDFDFPDNLLNP